jgi:hypothetical protein
MIHLILPNAGDAEAEEAARLSCKHLADSLTAEDWGLIRGIVELREIDLRRDGLIHLYPEVVALRAKLAGEAHDPPLTLEAVAEKARRMGYSTRYESPGVGDNLHEVRFFGSLSVTISSAETLPEVLVLAANSLDHWAQEGGEP